VVNYSITSANVTFGCHSRICTGDNGGCATRLVKCNTSGTGARLESQGLFLDVGPWQYHVFNLSAEKSDDLWTRQAKTRKRTLGIAVLILLLGGCLLVVSPFVSALLWAVVLSYSLWPLHRRLVNLFGGRKDTGLAGDGVRPDRSWCWCPSSLWA